MLKPNIQSKINRLANQLSKLPLRNGGKVSLYAGVTRILMKNFWRHLETIEDQERKKLIGTNFFFFFFLKVRLFKVSILHVFYMQYCDYEKH